MKKSLGQKAQSIFNVITKIFTNLAIVMVSLVFIKGFLDNSPVLKPFKVPSTFTQKGISGNLILALTLDKYNEITKEVLKEEDFDALAKKDLNFSATIQKASSVGASINSIIEIIRQELGMERNEISIDIADYPQFYRTYLKFPDNKYRKINITKDTTKILAEQVEEIAEKIAFEFIMNQTPSALINYLKATNYDLDDFEGYLQIALEKNPENKINHYLAWSDQLAAAGKMEKSYRKLMEAMEIDSTNSCLWGQLGNYYWNNGNYQKSLSTYEKAIEIDATAPDPYFYLAQYYSFIKEDYKKGLNYIDLSIKYSNKNVDFRNGNYIKGIIHANLLEQDSVIKYIELMNAASLSPEREADIWASYYGKKKDKDLFIKYAQRGFDYGLPIGTYLKEPPYSLYMNDADFLAFLERNKIEVPTNNKR